MHERESFPNAKSLEGTLASEEVGKNVVEGDAVLAACFWINQMPSSSIKNKIPHSILFPKEPLFHVDQRIFGCTCFVHNLSPGLDKLAA